MEVVKLTLIEPMSHKVASQPMLPSHKTAFLIVSTALNTDVRHFLQRGKADHYKFGRAVGIGGGGGR